ncbi:MAG TPA: lyase family protein [Candidatus Nanoarchaeia archaeon]|nr:lyase family protein [Candidatus Nanoarchaeia archaeon]
MQTLEEITGKLKADFNFSDASIALMQDKGLLEDQKRYKVSDFLDALSLPKQTFAEKRKKSLLERTIERGDGQEITTGRYERYVQDFKDISSEQTLVQGRMKFAVEYVIGLTDLVSGYPQYGKFIDRPFTEEEKSKLRSIYGDYSIRDYSAVQMIEKRTKHDVVAANTWVTLRADELGIDPVLMRKVVHFARTSEDNDANVKGELYMKALGKWTESLSKLVSTLESKAREYINVTCIAETHGQAAQLTTLGHIYANLAEQIRLHAEPLLREEMFRLEGKIAGAIGTDVDIKAALPVIPHRNIKDMYRRIVGDVFGLEYACLGNDQDHSNAAFARMLDTMVNVGMVVEKAATDTWLYASRGVLAKKTEKGESGSSAMPQKANPFLAEGAEALQHIMRGMIQPIKDMVIAYREQGDLRRSITKREAFHPIMLSIISIERLVEEINNYVPSIVEIEDAIYKMGPKIASSAVQTYLKAHGVEDSYDRIKHIVMKPYVEPDEVRAYILSLHGGGRIDGSQADHIWFMIKGVIDTKNNRRNLMKAISGEEVDAAVADLTRVNSDIESRCYLLGTAVEDTELMILNAKQTQEMLERYEKSA